MDLTLFLLRVVSASILLLLLATIFTITWRDYRQTIAQTTANHPIYGHLIGLKKKDDDYIETGETHLLKPLTRLGRIPTNDVIVDDTFTSSNHARITFQDGQWWLEDCKSRNGTTVNERPVQQPIVITGGDIIGIGQKLFQIRLE